MIDLKTGKIVINEQKGWVLEPGMKWEDLKKSNIYVNGPIHENYRLHPEWQGAFFEHIDIDGFDMSVDVNVDMDGYIDEIYVYHPDAHNQCLSKEEAYKFKAFHDEFISHQIGNQLKGSGEIWLDYDWGSITSEINLMHDSIVDIIIRYDTYPIRVAKGEIKPVTQEDIDNYYKKLQSRLKSKLQE